MTYNSPKITYQYSFFSTILYYLFVLYMYICHHVNCPLQGFAWTLSSISIWAFSVFQTCSFFYLRRFCHYFVHSVLYFPQFQKYRDEIYPISGVNRMWICQIIMIYCWILRSLHFCGKLKPLIFICFTLPFSVLNWKIDFIISLNRAFFL